MELIVAMGIIIVGLFSVWALFFSNFSAEQEAETRMVASNLAREGIEAVKNLRDSNWLALEDNATTTSGLWTWDNGFAASGYYTMGNIFSTSSSYVGSTTLILIPDQNSAVTGLYVNKDGFYDYNASGRITVFSRFLTIKNICCASANGLKCDNNVFDYKSLGVACSSGQIKIGVDVVCETRWLAGNKKMEKVTLEDQLFNWK